MAVFNEEEVARIEAAIAELESKSAGEVVVVSTRRCGRYLGERLAFAAIFGFTAALVLHAAMPALSAAWVLFAELAAASLAFLLAYVPLVLRTIVGRKEIERVVGEAALRAFAERGIFDTRDRTGVLVFLSELEHRVVILGDKGIHARVGAEGWVRLVGELTQGLAAHHGADGVCRLVAEIGEVLKREVPVEADDVNELPNAVIQDSDGRA
jgi:putative membrane protein